MEFHPGSIIPSPVYLSAISNTNRVLSIDFYFMNISTFTEVCIFSVSSQFLSVDSLLVNNNTSGFFLSTIQRAPSLLRPSCYVVLLLIGEELQQFSVGVNEIIRILERTHLIPSNERSSLSAKMHSARLQVVLISSDCHIRLLTKHLERLAISKKVPIVFVKDKKIGSLRFVVLVKLKTAIAIGIKFVVGLGDKVSPTGIEEGVRVGNFSDNIWFHTCK